MLSGNYRSPQQTGKLTTFCTNYSAFFLKRIFSSSLRMFASVFVFFFCFSTSASCGKMCSSRFTFSNNLKSPRCRVGCSWAWLKSLNKSWFMFWMLDTILVTYKPWLVAKLNRFSTMYVKPNGSTLGAYGCVVVLSLILSNKLSMAQFQLALMLSVRKRWLPCLVECLFFYCYNMLLTSEECDVICNCTKRYVQLVGTSSPNIDFFFNLIGLL